MKPFARPILHVGSSAAAVMAFQFAIAAIQPITPSEAADRTLQARPASTDIDAARGRLHAFRSPFAAVGRFEGTALCTATMVLHPRIIITAAHCITPRDGSIRSSAFFFRPGYRSDTDLGRFSATVWAVGAKQNFGAQSAHDASRDWAILLLDHAPEGIRPLLLESDSPETLRLLHGQILLPSYSIGVARAQSLGIDPACSIHGMMWEVLLHDCRVSFGASGAPLLVHHAEWYAVVGINTAALLTFDEAHRRVSFISNSATGAWSFAHALYALQELLNAGKNPEASVAPAY